MENYPQTTLEFEERFFWILLVEIKISHVEHVQVERLWEIGLSAPVILPLVFAYYLAAKVEKTGVD